MSLSEDQTNPTLSPSALYCLFSSGFDEIPGHHIIKVVQENGSSTTSGSSGRKTRTTAPKSGEKTPEAAKERSTCFHGFPNLAFTPLIPYPPNRPDIRVYNKKQGRNSSSFRPPSFPLSEFGFWVPTGSWRSEDRWFCPRTSLRPSGRSGTTGSMAAGMLNWVSQIPRSGFTQFWNIKSP